MEYGYRFFSLDQNKKLTTTLIKKMRLNDREKHFNYYLKLPKQLFDNLFVRNWTSHYKTL